MLKRNLIFFKSLKYFSSKAYLGIHHCLGDKYRTEILLTCDTCHNIILLLACALNNPCTRIFRYICIPDIDRYTTVTDRENRIFVQNRCSHIRKLTKLSVSNIFNRLWIRNDTWVCYKETGHICPVLVHICLTCLCNDRSCHIRTATGKCLDIPIFAKSVKSGNNCTWCLRQSLTKNLLCLIAVEISFCIEENHLCGINKFNTKICSHNLTIQKFSSGRCIINLWILDQLLCDLFKILIQREIFQRKPCDNLIISCLDCLHLFRNIFPCFCCLIHMEKHICYLRIFRKSLPRCRWNNIDATLIS